MFKIISGLLLVITTLTVNAQDKVIDLKFKEGFKYVDHAFSENGDIYIISGNHKSGNKGLIDFNKYDSNLEVIFSNNFITKYEPLSAFFGRGLDASPTSYELKLNRTNDLTLALTDSIVIDKDGKAKEFHFNILDERETFKSKASFYNKSFAFYFGNKVLSARKSEYSDELYIRRFSLKNSTNKTIELKLPAFETFIEGEKFKIDFGSKKEIEKSKNKVSYEVGESSNENILLINKELSKDKKQNQYNLLSIDSIGNVVKKTSFLLNFKDKYFALSNNGLSSQRQVTTTSSVSSYIFLSETATGNVYVDGTNEDFYYVYGIYSEKLGPIMNIVYPKGFYVYKFDTNGKLVWKVEKEISDKDFGKGNNPIDLTLNFFKIKDNKAVFDVFSYNHEIAYYSVIDLNLGKIEQNESISYDVDRTKYNAYRGNQIKTGIKLKDFFGKNNLDINTLIAARLNKKVDNYLKKNLKVERDYNTFISKSGIFIIENNHEEKTFKLLKFDW